MARYQISITLDTGSFPDLTEAERESFEEGIEADALSRFSNKVEVSSLVKID